MSGMKSTNFMLITRLFYSQVRTYCHGTLYSVFARAGLRAAATARGTPELLESLAGGSSQVFAQQVGTGSCRA